MITRSTGSQDISLLDDSFDEANSQWKVDAGNYLFKVGSDVENIKGTATLKVAEYTEKTSNACAPKVQLNYLRKK